MLSCFRYLPTESRSGYFPSGTSGSKTTQAWEAKTPNNSQAIAASRAITGSSTMMNFLVVCLQSRGHKLLQTTAGPLDVLARIETSAQRSKTCCPTLTGSKVDAARFRVACRPTLT